MIPARRTLSVRALTCVLLATAGLLSSSPAIAVPDGRDTRTTARLDRQLRPDGAGVWVRAPDGLATPLLPTSWLRNDIHGPTTMYVAALACHGGNPVPSTWDGYRFQKWLNVPATDGRTATACLPFLGRDANLAATVGLAATGVAPAAIAAMYPTDAGSDTRCTRANTRGCRAGNPDNILAGVGRGCYPHQVTARGGGRATAVGSNCRCPADMTGPAWVDQLLSHADPAPPYTYFRGNRRGRPYFEPGGRRGKAPMLVLADVSACWTPRPRQLVGIQNALWHARFTWWNGRAPQAPRWARADLSGPRRIAAMKYYAGWNEVLVRASAWAAATDATVVKLPAGAARISDLPPWAISLLGRSLVTWRSQSFAELPVVVLTERYRGRDRWTRHFHAEEFDFLPFGSQIRIECERECRLKS